MINITKDNFQSHPFHLTCPSTFFRYYSVVTAHPFLAPIFTLVSTLKSVWILSRPPNPHVFISLPLESKVNIKFSNLKFSNLKDKFTLINISTTLVSLGFAYLLKLGLIYLLTLKLNTWEDFFLLGFIFENVFTVLYCMDGPGSASGSGSGSASGSGSGSGSASGTVASAKAEAEAAGSYYKYPTPESAERAKKAFKEIVTSEDKIDFDESFTPKDCLDNHRQKVKNLEETISKLSKVKGYFEAIDAKREPTPQEAMQYLIEKARHLQLFDNKETRFGRKIDFNNPTNVKEISLETLKNYTRMLDKYSARLKMFENLPDAYMTNKDKYSKITEGLLEVDRRHRRANAELEKSVLEAWNKRVDLNTKKN